MVLKAALKYNIRRPRSASQEHHQQYSVTILCGTPTTRHCSNNGDCDGVVTASEADGGYLDGLVGDLLTSSPMYFAISALEANQYPSKSPRFNLRTVVRFCTPHHRPQFTPARSSRGPCHAEVIRSRLILIISHHLHGEGNAHKALFLSL